MNLLPKKLALLAVASALVFAGCSKKPIRPDPGATVLGPAAGGAGGINPMDINAGDLGLTDPSASGLTSRGDGVIETEDMIKGLIQPVYFDYDQSAIRASERSKLQAAQEHLASNPQHRILLEGHCDWRGTAEYNLGLGDRRAGAASQFLATLGVAASRIETLSKGDLEAVENASEDQMSRDRRVEIIILKR
jgi:peptidoglycan-associated lipoprotein